MMPGGPREHGDGPQIQCPSQAAAYRRAVPGRQSHHADIWRLCRWFTLSCDNVPKATTCIRHALRPPILAARPAACGSYRCLGQRTGAADQLGRAGAQPGGAERLGRCPPGHRAGALRCDLCRGRRALRAGIGRADRGGGSAVWHPVRRNACGRRIDGGRNRTLPCRSAPSGRCDRRARRPVPRPGPRRTGTRRVQLPARRPAGAGVSRSGWSTCPPH